MFTLSNKTTRNAMIAAILMCMGSLNGCSSFHAGANHRPIIDGTMDASYEQDLSQCQSFAQQREYVNGETKSDMMIGGALGAISGLSGGAGDVVGSALVGSAIGGGIGAFDTRTERKNIVINCMARRGYKVLESQGQHN